VIALVKNKQIILMLAGYIFLMGLVGYFRSGSFEIPVVTFSSANAC